MRFKDWHNLIEIFHHTLESPQTINGVQCDGIDFRFEDWSKGFNPQKSMAVGHDEVQMMPNPKQFVLTGSYRAPCKEGWFVVDKRKTKDTGGPSQMGGLGLATQAQPDIQVIQQINPEIDELPAMPKSWFRFCVLYLGNNVVKEPEWPRGDYEMVNKSQGQTEMKPLRVEEG